MRDALRRALSMVLAFCMATSPLAPAGAALAQERQEAVGYAGEGLGYDAPGPADGYPEAIQPDGADSDGEGVGCDMPGPLVCESEAPQDYGAGVGADDAGDDMPAFDAWCVVDGVRVAVREEAGAFPASAELRVEVATPRQEELAEEAVGEVRGEGENVAVSRTYDVRAVDPTTGEDLQPVGGRTVEVSFTMAEVADANLTTSVYHILEDGRGGDPVAEGLRVSTEVTPDTGEDTTAVVESDGFSLYTVEFTYGDLEYALEGGSSVPLVDVLASIGLAGEPEAVEVSDASLFSASWDAGGWVVYARRAFGTDEWMRVTINGVEYEIAVTDDRQAVSYIYHECDDTGITATRTDGSCEDYVTVGEGTTAWGASGGTSWYVASGSVEIGSRVAVSGDVRLILLDGASLTVRGGIGVGEGQSLTIYAQSDGVAMGALTVTDVGDIPVGA